MDIGIIGVSYKSADLSFRERLVRNLNQIEFDQLVHPFSKVTLMTCNRFEVYFHAPSLTEAHSDLLHDFTQEYNQHSSHQLYSYFGVDCFAHLVKVTAGMDSALFAETEIQGQVKLAYTEAKDKGPLSKELHFLFQKSLKVAKDIRQKMPLQRSSSDLVHTVINLQRELKMIAHKPKILFVGASQINQQILKNMNLEEFEIFLTNRTESRGKEIAEKYNIHHLSWDKLNRWAKFDGLVVATKAYECFIQKAPTLLQTPKMLVDLSVPRNISEKLALNPMIQLFNIDQIQQMAHKPILPIHTFQKQLCEMVQEEAKRQKAIFQKKSFGMHKELQVV